MSKILVIDAFSLLYKAFYAVRGMSSPDGTPTNAIYGFFSMLFSVMRKESPDRVFAAFDAARETFRTGLYAGYKATRDASPEDLTAQTPIVREILAKAGVAFLSVPGFEADDIIGTLSAAGDAAGDETVIVTGDRDSFQLVSPLTRVLYSKKGVSDALDVTPEYVLENIGVTPSQLVDVKALMGDKSDNIPGVSGVGEKTAVSLVSRFGTLDAVYENLEQLTGKVKSNLAEGREQAFMSRDLARIVRTVPGVPDGQSGKADFASEEIHSLFLRYSLRTLAKSCGYDPSKAPAPAQPAAPAGSSPWEAGYVKSSYSPGMFSGRRTAAWADFRAGTLAVRDGDVTHVFEGAEKGAFAGYFSDPDTPKTVWNLKDLIRELSGRGIGVSGAELDVMIAAYVIAPGDTRYDLATLAEKYLGRTLPSPASAGPRTFFDADGESSGRSPALLARVVGELGPLLEARLEADSQGALYRDIEHPLIAVLARMEEAGFFTRRAVLDELGAEYSARMETLLEDIRRLGGVDGDFNVNSPRQLASLLFDRLGLPAEKKTKTGYSTDSDVLEGLRDKHPVVSPVMEYRAVSKLWSTYVTAFPKLIDPRDARIHTSFNQTGTSTGRLSSSNPNLQNIPVRSEEGRLIRKAFIAGNPGWTLVDADYSQIELRVLAHVSGDESLIRSFLAGEDIHARTASEVFGVPLEQVTKSMRSSAKAVNFGIVYGISDFGLARNLSIPKRTAQEYISRYLERFSGVKAYMARIVEKARADSFVTTIFSRRCYVPDINSANRTLRSFAERVALNAPIQGSAADIMKIAMIRVSDRLALECPSARLILQVHDELLVECPREDAGKAGEIVRGEMQSAASLSVPLIADVSTGDSWYDAK